MMPSAPDDVEPLIISPLPRRVRPILNETIDSYLLRIGNANHLHPMEVRSMITGESKYEPRPNPIPAPRLAQLTGIPARTLALALPELAHASLQPLPITGRPRPEVVRARPACMRCVGGRTAEPWGAPRVWSLHEDAILCIRHRCLHGQPALSLSAIPEAVAAARQHKRLIRRYGRETVRSAFHNAVRITGEYPAAIVNFHERMEILCGPDWQVHRNDPRYIVSIYPEAVELTKLLASPYWKALILNGHMPDDAINWADVDTRRFTIVERNPGQHGFILRRESSELRQFENEVHRKVSPYIDWLPRLANSDEASLAGWVHNVLKRDCSHEGSRSQPEPREAFS